MAHGRIKYTPRWIYNDVVLPPRSDAFPRGVVELEPTRFQNDTIWVWDLEHFTFYVPRSIYGGSGLTIEARLGVSGQSDINLVNAPVSVLAGSMNMRKLRGRFTSGLKEDMLVHDFKHPYRLAKDDGFRVRVKQNDDNWSFFAYGRGVDSGRPYTFMARSSDMNESGEEELYSADLMNSGIEDVDIHRVGFEDPWASDDKTSFLVNPITGVRWMPGEAEVPSKLLAPYTIPAYATNGDNDALNGSFAVQFPENTKLRRRQRLRVRLQNTDNTNNLFVRMALFGYLEVK